MDTTSLEDQLEILRRIGERGLKKAENDMEFIDALQESTGLYMGDYVTLFHHLLDEIERTKLCLNK